MPIQSRAIHSLSEYFEADIAARAHNLDAYDLEVELASILFEAAQMAVAAYPIVVDQSAYRAKYSLACAAIRYYATAVDLCLRGNSAEAQGVMRSSIECMAYAWRLVRAPELVDQWVDADEMTTAQRRKVFGSESELMRDPAIAGANDFYGQFSVFGVHARWLLTEQTADFEYPGGWRLRHAERGSEHVRYFLFGVLFTMRDLIEYAIAPLVGGPDIPEEVAALLARFESRRADLGKHRMSFVQWMKNPQRSKRYDGRVILLKRIGPAGI